MGERDFAAAYESLRPWLPGHAADVLDIGCGHADIDVFLARHYLALNGRINIHLLDGDEADMALRDQRKAYAPHPRPWNNRSLGVKTLQDNVPECTVYAYPPDPSLTIPCDLLISTRSWGHHYPIAVYGGLAKRSVRRGGRIITDIRTRLPGNRNAALPDTRGEIAALERLGFRVISKNIELHSQKCIRLVFER
jgi:hypothetical protein